jgi:site-specific recombinase XerD
MWQADWSRKRLTCVGEIKKLKSQSNEARLSEVSQVRHRHASAPLKAGASIKAASQRLGRSTVALTLLVYFHLMLNVDESLSQITDSLMG